MKSDNLSVKLNRWNNKMAAAERRETLGWQVLKYSILFAITAVCSYIILIVFSKTFLTDADGNVDGMAQQYPMYTEIKRMVHNVLAGGGLDTWSWDIGLGDDTLITFNTRLLNPLTYLVIAFPQKYLDVGFTLMILIYQYLSGLTFMLLGRKVGLNYAQTIMGGLCYAFCGWIIFAILHQGTFLIATVLFPLIILGTEKLLRGESPLLFIITVALHVIYSVLWAYVAGITILIYFPVRYLTAYKAAYKESGTKFVTKLGVFMGCGIVGIMTSGLVLVQNYAKINGATTKATVSSDMFYTLAEYLALPKGLFQATSNTGLYSVIGTSVICVILLPFFVKSAKKKSTPAIMALGLFAASLLPITGRIFNGFSYSVCRWFYALVFFIIWGCMELYKAETFSSRRNIRRMAAWIGGLFVWIVIVCHFVLDIVNLTGTLTVSAEVLLAGFLIYYISKHPDFMQDRFSGLVVTAVAVASIATYTNMTLMPGLGDYAYALSRAGRFEAMLETSTQRVGQNVQEEDESFYRIDQVDGYTDTRIARVRANENMYFGNRSIYTYLSTMDKSWHEFNRVMGNNAGYFDRTTSYSNDNREGLDFLMGVKYFLGDNELLSEGASDYAGYGFSYYKTIDGVEVLKNKYCMGLGTAYNQYISESELMEYSPLEREQVLMQAVVVSDEDADTISSVHHADKAEIRTDIRELDFKIENLNNINIDGAADGGSMTVKSSDEGGSFTLTIPEVQNCRIVVAFDNLVKRDLEYDDYLEMLGKTYSKNALAKMVKDVSYEDSDKFQISVSRGNVLKAAQVRKGKNQGFSDVTDFNINLGYYETISGEINININKIGIYDYDAIHVYAVPMDIYDEGAAELEENSLKISNWNSEVVSGTITADEDSIIYLSIFNQPGWSIYIDGVKAEKLDSVNISFTGVMLEKGKHEILLKYSSPGLKIGLLLTASGIVLAIIIEFIYRKRRNASEN